MKQIKWHIVIQMIVQNIWPKLRVGKGLGKDKAHLIWHLEKRQRLNCKTKILGSTFILYVDIVQRKIQIEAKGVAILSTGHEAKEIYEKREKRFLKYYSLSSPHFLSYQKSVSFKTRRTSSSI